MNKVILILGILFLQGYLHAMQEAPATERGEPTIIEEYEPNPFQIFRYAELTFINTTAYTIDVVPVKKDNSYASPIRLEPGKKKPNTINLDLTDSIKIFYTGYPDSVTTVSINELRTQMDQKASYIADIIIRAGIFGGLYVDYTILQGAQKQTPIQYVEEGEFVTWEPERKRL